MESPQTQTTIGRTANPEAAWDHGELANLAKLVDKSTLHRKKLSMLVSRRVGNESVEAEAVRWGLAEENAGLESLTKGRRKGAVCGLSNSNHSTSRKGTNGDMGLLKGIGTKW